MGTGAVYVTLSGVKEHSKVLTNVETAFFFLNMFFFLLNSTTLALQAICTSFLISVGRARDKKRRRSSRREREREKDKMTTTCVSE
jgi:hypothetical protein